VRQARAAPRTGWQASLRLSYAVERERTIVVERAHRGPLVVQKPFYPEGPQTCHSIIVHPPGGIAGGDCLSIQVTLQPGAQALITTPGATKWYKTSQLAAHQDIAIHVAEHAIAEWLPQETIVFNGAHARLATRIALAPGAKYLGWEIVCLGRSAAGEKFSHGRFQQQTEIWQADQPLWIERGVVDGEGAMRGSPIGLDGRAVFATLIAAGCEAAPATLSSCREISVGADDQCGITQLPGVLCARYLGASTLAAKQYFIALWNILRPALLEKAMTAPRIWQT
jgi:urease accessory protein